MNVLEAIETRRSIRTYTDEPVTEAELSTILKAAYASPVGSGNYDDFQLNVITDKTLMNEIEENYCTVMNKPGRTPLYGAPMLIVVSTKLSDIPIMNNGPYSSCAIIVQNMSLAATELGLGTCHIWGAIRGMNSTPELVSKLNLKEGLTPVASLIIGHTDENMVRRTFPDERMKTIRQL